MEQKVKIYQSCHRHTEKKKEPKWLSWRVILKIGSLFGTSWCCIGYCWIAPPLEPKWLQPYSVCRSAISLRPKIESTDKTKGTFWGAEGAIQAYHSLYDQLEPFWLLLEIHVSGSPGDPKWLPGRPPLNTEVWLPPESQFGSSSVISDLFVYASHMWTSYGGLYVNVKLHFLYHFLPFGPSGLFRLLRQTATSFSLFLYIWVYSGEVVKLLV